MNSSGHNDWRTLNRRTAPELQIFQGTFGENEMAGKKSDQDVSWVLDKKTVTLKCEEKVQIECRRLRICVQDDQSHSIFERCKLERGALLSAETSDIVESDKDWRFILVVFFRCFQSHTSVRARRFCNLQSEGVKSR